MDDIEMNSHLLLGQINNVLDTVRLDEGCLGANVEDVDVYDVVALVRRVSRCPCARAFRLRLRWSRAFLSCAPTGRCCGAYP